MATSNQNLSDYNKDSIPSAENMKFCIVVSMWNDLITVSLLNGAYQTLLLHGASEENILVKHVPGSFELPLAAQLVLENKKDIDAVICLGSVIRGETSHFNYVCEAVSQGIKDVGLTFSKPVIFGVLTDDNIQQSIDRSGGKHGNKGDEAAVSAIQMVALSRDLGS